LKRMYTYASRRFGPKKKPVLVQCSEVIDRLGV